MSEKAIAEKPTHKFYIYQEPSVKVDAHDAFLDLKGNASSPFRPPENGGHWVRYRKLSTVRPR